MRRHTHPMQVARNSMMTSRSELCPHCGAKMVLYPHSLSRTLIRVLYIVVTRAKDGLFTVKGSGMNRNQAGNLQKLRYWDFISRADLDGIGGVWHVTPKAVEFLSGNKPEFKKVWTYRGDVMSFDGKLVNVDEITDGWKYRPDYAREAVPLVN